MKRTLLILAISLFALFGALAVLLNLPRVQNKLMQQITQVVSIQSGLQLDIQQVEVNVFKGIVLEQVVVQDSSGQEWLRAHKIEVGIKWLPLLRRRLDVYALRIIQAEIYAHRVDSDSALNWITVINAFRKKPTSTPFDWNIRIQSLLFRRCLLRYDVLSEPYVEGFDPNHIELQEFSTVMRLDLRATRYQRFHIAKMDFKTPQGVALQHLDVSGKIEDGVCSIDALHLMGQGSKLEVSPFTYTFDTGQLSTTVMKGFLVLNDFSGFFPMLSGIHRPIEVSLSLNGSQKDLNIQSILLNFENQIILDAKAELIYAAGTTGLDGNAQIRSLHMFPEGLEYVSSILTQKNVPIPFLRSLGAFVYMGNVNFDPNGLNVMGDFSTQFGNVNTDLTLLIPQRGLLQYAGRVGTETFQIQQLLPSNKFLGNIAFDLSVEGKQDIHGNHSGIVTGDVHEFDWNQVRLQHLSLDGQYASDGFTGKMQLNDEKASFDFDGHVRLAENNSEFQFELDVQQLDLQALGLVGHTDPSKLSFQLQADFSGREINDLVGSLQVVSLSFQNHTDTFFLPTLSLQAIPENHLRRYVLHSEVLNGEATGYLDIKNWKHEFHRILTRYIPLASKEPWPQDNMQQNQLDFRFDFNPPVNLARLLDLPIQLASNVEIEGFYQGAGDRFRMNVLVPLAYYNDIDIRNFKILLENPLNEIKCITHAQLWQAEDFWDLDLDMRLMQNRSNIKFFWSNNQQPTHAGSVATNIQFTKDAKGALALQAHVIPASILIRDSLWTLHQAKLEWGDRRLGIEGLEMSHRDAFIRVNGVASALPNDRLHFTFNDFLLDDIFQLLPRMKMTFGGRITGQASIPHLLDKPSMNAALEVEDFTFNHVELGHLSVQSSWNHSDKRLDMEGRVQSSREDLPTKAFAKGFYKPTEKFLDLNIDAEKANLAFLRPYLGSILHDINGLGTGKVRIMGGHKEIGIYADALVESGSFGVEMLNTRYYFEDSVHLTPQWVRFENIVAKDREGNQAVINGRIAHNRFKQMQLDIDIEARRLLAMDLPAKPDAYFYGTAYGSGNVSITGPQSNIMMDINVRTDDRTRATIALLDNFEVSEYDFIRYVQSDSNDKGTGTRGQDPERIAREPILPNNFTVNLQIEATPNAELTLITDPTSGDEIKARGSGAIRAVINTESDLELFGRYTLESGSYRFIYEQILKRDFDIVRGGSISFSGDPFAADLNIVANHSVNAQLSDLLSLDDLNSLNMSRSTIPVDCQLTLKGELQQPNIGLGLNFPSADDELRRRIMNVINTEEALNQQIVFLLVFGRFNSTDTYASTEQSNLSTVLNTTFSTLSSQFNNMLNNALGSSNVSFDFNYQNASYEQGQPGEWEVGLSGQWLDNRLTFKSNIGSREDLSQTGTSQFIGEFDLNLRMKNSEKWSWKLFNRANDNRYFKSALNTQGVGVVYRENFNTLQDFVRQIKRRNQ